MLEHRDFIGADRQRRRIRQRRLDAEPSRHFDDLGAAGLAGFRALPPIAIESLTGTTLIERVMAWVSVTGPE